MVKKTAKTEITQMIAPMFLTASGITAWWTRPRKTLDGKSCEQMLAEDPERVWALAKQYRGLA